MSNIAIETLTKKLNELIAEKEVVNQDLDNKIRAFKIALKNLGVPVEEIKKGVELFDDTNPDYIRSSQEEI